MGQKFTGERYLFSQIDDQISVEHKHRYQLASLFTSDKKTLDLGCGSGYGSVYLNKASSYLGVDISPETIEECTSKFSGDNIKFKVANAQNLDLLDASFDVITCFEVLEHVTEPEKIVSEASRVLSPDGLFISSTPDIENYNSVLFEPNPFHLREMNRTEYQQLLTSQFRYNKIIGQYFSQCSFIFDSESSSNLWTQASEKEGGGEFKPLYWIGISSNLELPDFDIKSLFPSSFSRNLGGELVQMKKQSDIFHDELRKISNQ
jgi:ubiquinone/menaquinone biosynthesis C-methylase UbiE